MAERVSFWIDDPALFWRGFEVGDEAAIVVAGETVGRARVVSIEPDGNPKLVMIQSPKSGG